MTNSEMPTANSVRVTQIGSWSGTDVAMALRIAFEETPDLPVLPELPARGPAASMIGRATALLSGLDVDLQPAGWRLIHGTAGDHRLARGLFRDDVEQLEGQAQEWQGAVKIAVTGPWTMAANLELPMGEKVLSDRGARRDVAGSLAQGIADLRSDLARRLPQVTVIVQLDEPMLPLVLTGAVRTASGLNRYRAVDESELIEPLEAFVASGETWLHSCASGVPLGWLARVDGLGLSMDESLVDRAGWDVLGPLLEEGRPVALGVVGTGPDAIARHVLRRIEQLGLGAEVAQGLWLTPTCGLAGATERDAVRMIRDLRGAAEIVTEELHGE